ncbi:MAG: NAD(P)/FAD-dependent oxidoreductase [Dehalococcoidia bacterium]|nr:NAD(P)/FAD-dependent oxidoreductase [Dehalococcoidia bacterium]
MKTYEVIVVGGGPAGATAARRLARQGFGVLLLEKEIFPRHKPCGGALSPKTYSQLDFDISDLIKARVRRTLVRGPGKPFVLESQDTEIWIVSRDELDLRLLDQASQAGAVVQQGEPVEAVLAGGEGVVTAGGEYRARVLVGADGYRSLVARSVGLEYLQPRLFRSLQLECSTEGKPRTEAILDFAYPGGYAWLFPEGDLVNVGICTGRKGWSLKPRLAAFLQREGLDLACSPVYHSWPIPIGGSPRPLHRGNVLVVGDAAGLADPILGEGIAYAIMSAQLAAVAITDYLKGDSQDLVSYSDMISRNLNRDLRLLGRGAALLYRFPRLVLAFLRASPKLQASAFRVLSGRRSLSGLWGEKGISSLSR